MRPLQDKLPPHECAKLLDIDGYYSSSLRLESSDISAVSSISHKGNQFQFFHTSWPALEALKLPL